MSQALLDEYDAQHRKRLAALGISADDYVDYEPGSAGTWLLKTEEYRGFWDPFKSVIQIYGVRSSRLTSPCGNCTYIKADLCISNQCEKLHHVGQACFKASRG